MNNNILSIKSNLCTILKVENFLNVELYYMYIFVDDLENIPFQVLFFCLFSWIMKYKIVAALCLNLVVIYNIFEYTCTKVTPANYQTELGRGVTDLNESAGASNHLADQLITE